MIAYSFQNTHHKISLKQLSVKHTDKFVRI